MKMMSKCRKLGISWARKVAKKNANSTCPLISYQKELPKEVKKLKK